MVLAYTTRGSVLRKVSGSNRGQQGVGNVSLFAENACSVQVQVSIDPAGIDMDKWRAVTGFNPAPKLVLGAMTDAVMALLSDRLSKEFETVVDAYRVMLRESLARGDDSELKAALNRARLQEKILATASMVDQTQACELLGLSTANPSATLKRKEDKRELLRFTVDGRAAYPLFQFDVEGRRLFPAMAKLIEMKPEAWSAFRLLHWLTRSHLDLGSTPAECLGTGEDAVMDAFTRAITPSVHG